MTDDADLARARVKESLAAWCEAGWLRRLDVAFAGLIGRLCPDASPDVLTAAALLAHREGQGHTCLPLGALVESQGASLEWPDAAGHALQDHMVGLSQSLTIWDEALQRCNVVRTLPAADERQPLVWDGHRLYLRRYWLDEERLKKSLLERSIPVPGRDPALVRQWLNRLFEPGAGFDWQKAACAIAARAPISIVTGGPGTGKTYTAARLIALLCALDTRPQGPRIALAAPTGKAAARLKQSIDAALTGLPTNLHAEPSLGKLAERIGAGRTLHSLLGARPETRRFKHDARNPLDLDLLVVDEASMVHLEMMASLLDALPPRAILVLLGDKDQLASVEAGAVLGDLCHDAAAAPYSQATRAYLREVLGEAPPAMTDGEHPTGSALAQQTVMLRESRRFAGPIGELAQAVNAGDAFGVRRVLAAGHAQVRWSAQATADDVVHAAMANGLRQWGLSVAGKPPGTHVDAFEPWARQTVQGFDACRILSAVHEGPLGVDRLNEAVEAVLSTTGLRRSGEWYEGRPVMVTRNDPARHVFNGDVGVTLKAPTGGLRVYFQTALGLHSLPTNQLSDVKTAFAMTIHKSQGSEFDAVILVMPSAGKTSKELIYTGITRARRFLSIYIQGEEQVELMLARRINRDSGLEFCADGDAATLIDECR